MKHVPLSCRGRCGSGPRGDGSPTLPPSLYLRSPNTPLEFSRDLPFRFDSLSGAAAIDRIRGRFASPCASRPLLPLSSNALWMSCPGLELQGVELDLGIERSGDPHLVVIEAACSAHPTADVFINFASFRRLVILLLFAAASSMSALKQPTIRVVAIIAEGVPESDTKQLIAYARANNKVLIGPATVGGIQAGAFKIGDTAGTIDNIVQCKLYRPGSVGFVSKS
ncbi:hypothetical protein BHE74_00037327, partial [Ensete ventricosum]